MLYPASSRKSGSKLLGIWTFILFLILKGAFPKPALALSTVGTCAAQPECAAALGSELNGTKLTKGVGSKTLLAQDLTGFNH